MANLSEACPRFAVDQPERLSSCTTWPATSRLRHRIAKLGWRNIQTSCRENDDVEIDAGILITYSSGNMLEPVATKSPDVFRSLNCHAGDHRRLRHARETHVGFAVGRYLQPPPMLFTRDGHNVFLGDMYRGHTAFLLCGGPSLPTHDLTKLQQRGLLTCAINNTATVFRPHLWVSVDPPGHFCDAIWYDPEIMKFVPLCHMEKTFMVRGEDDTLVPSTHVVGDMPAVFGYRRNEDFNANQWLYEDTFNWGNHSAKVDAYGNKGSRSVFYIALRLMFYLGIRRLFLLGCDFRMEKGKQNYAFEQDRTAAAVRGNNSSYHIMNVRLKHLVPSFKKEGYQIFNCTPDSGLTVFPYMSFDEAVAIAREIMPKQINTVGMYDREQREKDAQQKQEN